MRRLQYPWRCVLFWDISSRELFGMNVFGAGRISSPQRVPELRLIL